MKFDVEIIRSDDSDNIAIISTKDCSKIGINIGERVTVSGKASAVVAVVTGENGIDRRTSCIMISEKTAESIGVKCGDEVEVENHSTPESVMYIQKKANGGKLTEDEIKNIVDDIRDRRLTMFEISTWLNSIQNYGFTKKEQEWYTFALSGHEKTYGGNVTEKIYGFHSISGIPGNKITPIIVSIISSVGVKICKVPTRAISGACGTIDFFETVCKTDLDDACFENSFKKTGAVISSDVNMDIVPADKILIKVQRDMCINPRSQLLASIIAVNKAIGVDCLIIDIPYGAGSKMKNHFEAKKLASEFEKLGNDVGMEVISVLTDGSHPLGHAVGPNLEAKEMLQVLEGKAYDQSVKDKACHIAGKLLQMAGVKNGIEKAKDILSSGKALEKLREIIASQGGNPDIKSDDIAYGKYSIDVKSEDTGIIRRVNNRSIIFIAKTAGSPIDKGAGLLLRKKKGDTVHTGDVLYTIYSDYKEKAEQAVRNSKSMKVYETVTSREKQS